METSDQKNQRMLDAAYDLPLYALHEELLAGYMNFDGQDCFICVATGDDIIERVRALSLMMIGEEICLPQLQLYIFVLGENSNRLAVFNSLFGDVDIIESLKNMEKSLTEDGQSVTFGGFIKLLQGFAPDELDSDLAVQKVPTDVEGFVDQEFLGNSVHYTDLGNGLKAAHVGAELEEGYAVWVALVAQDEALIEKLDICVQAMQDSMNEEFGKGCYDLPFFESGKPYPIPRQEFDEETVVFWQAFEEQFGISIDGLIDAVVAQENANAAQSPEDLDAEQQFERLCAEKSTLTMPKSIN